MRLLHLGDLHIGKRVNEVLMLDEQKFALKQVLNICEDKKIEVVLISGDVYDKSTPIIDAVTAFSEFLTQLYNKGIFVFIISGNHDSPRRLEFGKNILKNDNVFIEGVFNGEIKKITKKDSFGNVNFYLLPFIHIAEIKAENGNSFSDYTRGFDYLIKKTEIDENERNIILAHQFVTNAGEEAERCASEIVSIGGLDNVDCSVFKPFDYVALGHLHRPQKIGRESIRYSGSLLKYSFSEVNDKKSVPVIELGEKGDLSIELVPIKPLRDMREIKGKMQELLTMAGDKNDYIRAIITDEEEVYDAIGKLRAVYPNLMKLEFKNKKTVFNENSKTMAENVENKTPNQLFSEFFEIQNNVEMNEEQREIITEILKKMEEERYEAN